MSQDATADERHRALVQSIHKLADYVERNPHLGIEHVRAYIDLPWGAEGHAAVRGLVDVCGFELQQEWPARATLAIGEDVEVAANIYDRDAVLEPVVVDGEIRWILPAFAPKAVAA